MHISLVTMKGEVWARSCTQSAPSALGGWIWKLALGLVEPPTAGLSPTMQPVCIPTPGLPSPRHVHASSQRGVQCFLPTWCAVLPPIASNSTTEQEFPSLSGSASTGEIPSLNQTTEAAFPFYGCSFPLANDLGGDLLPGEIFSIQSVEVIIFFFFFLLEDLW